MTDYDDDIFEREDSQQHDDELHLLKFSIDILSVKDLRMAANIFVQYTLNLN